MKSTFLAAALSVLCYSASAAQTPPTSEHGWAMRQILGDIQEMAGKPVSVSEAEIWSMLPWNTGQPLVAFAAAQFGRGGAEAGVLPEQHSQLTQASVAQLLAASADVSQALKQNMRNPRAHEAAALVLGSFGLLESAANFSDTRWVMNRMTAHLAVALALRGGSALSVDGDLASATLAA